MNYLEKFDSVLLSDNVVDNFYNEFNNNPSFKQWLISVLPEIEECERQQQNHPWHIYNVLGHILHSVENMNSRTKKFSASTQKMLAFVMLFHDIGKPSAHSTRVKDGKVIDSFFNHNVKSEAIAQLRLPAFGFDQNQIKVMKKLIYNHDIFMFIKDFETDNPNWRTLSPQVVKSEIADLNKVGDGVELMKYLILIGYADNSAQNQVLAKDAKKLIEKFEKIYVEIVKNN